MTEVMDKFLPRSYGKCNILEASSPQGTVQIFNDYGDGKPVTFFTDAAVKDVKEETTEFGFRNCQNCKATAITKARAGGLSKFLCCRPQSPRTVHVRQRLSTLADIALLYGNMAVVDDAVPRAARVIAEAVPIAKDPEGVKLLAEGSQQHRSYYIDGKAPTPQLDPVNQVFYKKIGELYVEAALHPRSFNPWREAIYNKVTSTWGVTMDDHLAVKAWWDMKKAGPNLEGALTKLNPVQGVWTISTQRCPDELVKTLKAGGPGSISRGPPGVYSIRGDYFKEFRASSNI